MKIRTRFTFFISAISLISAILVYIFVVTELGEEQFMLIDRELHDVGTALLNKASRLSPQPDFSTDYPLDRYWIRLSGKTGAVLYQSRLAGLVALPVKTDRNKYFVKARVPIKDIWIEPKEEDERHKLDEQVRFRVLKLRKQLDNQILEITIAKPIPLVALEMGEILYELIIGGVIFTILVIIASYVLAGKMLRPLKVINTMTRDIRQSSLDRRIPLSKSRDELHELSLTLNDMFDRLQLSFQKQKTLISDASHELKSPLTILRLSIEDLLTEDIPDAAKDELDKQLLIIQRIQKLTADLLDISRLEQQDTLARERLQISTMMNETIEEFRILLSAKRISVSLDLNDFSFWADRAKMQRLFVILIDNAIKYNIPEGGEIAIRFTRFEELLEIEIANTGPVLSPAECVSIFKQFYRVEKSRSQQFGGTGLGLTIARRIVKMHGGTITASGKGSTNRFVVRIPVFYPPKTEQ